MSSNVTPRSNRRIDKATVCVASQGKLCRCLVCTSSFVSNHSTVSDVSTTCPPSEIDDLQAVPDFVTPRTRVRCAALQAFPTATTIAELDYHDQDNQAEDSVGSNGSPSKLNSSLSPAQPLARTDSVSSVASDRTVCSPKVNALRRNESAVSTAATADDYEYEDAHLAPLPSIQPIRAPRLSPTHSDYNITPTPIILLGRPRDRRRFF